MAYRPGTHVIATLRTDNDTLLISCASFKEMMEAIIQEHSLQKLGDVYHDFPSGGYTAVICLSESHISIHTWPEHSLVNLDIYLSNFQRNNDGSVEAIYNKMKDFFCATVAHQQIITR